MTRSRHLAWRLSIAVVSLSLAISVYCFARLNPPEIFSPFLSTHPDLASFNSFFGSAPSFFYTLALGLVIGVCVSSTTSAKFHCLIWIGLCMFLELTQLATPAAMLSNTLPELFPNAVWRLIGPFWQRGTFDSFDLLATLAGGLLALTLVVYWVPRGRSASN